MRAKRLREGRRVLFDYRDLVDKRKHKGEVLLRMKKGPISYNTGSIRFFSEHPFQWVPKEEAERLLGFDENNFVHFVEATIEQVEDHYVD